MIFRLLAVYPVFFFSSGLVSKLTFKGGFLKWTALLVKSKKKKEKKKD